MLNITLPDGSQRQFAGPVTVAEVAAAIGPGLAKAALAGKLTGAGGDKLVDASHRIDADARLAIVTDKDPDGLEIIRHSTAHLLAYAVKELFPDAQVTIGPVVEHGFYYDFAYKRPFTPEDLAAIEKRMGELAAKNEPVVRRVMPSRRGGRLLQGPRRALQGRDHRQHPGRRGHQPVRAEATSGICAAARTCRARGGSSTSS
jgi:threonyl-tRNA synthetase